jgi:hypothetical protein
MTDAFFDAVSEVLSEEDAKTERATTAISDAQKYIDFGTKVFLLTPSQVKQDLVVGRIVQPNEWADLRTVMKTLALGQWPNMPVGSDEELRKQHEDGYRLGLFFGTDYNLGYIASYHISRLYPLTETEFDSIRELDCDLNECSKQTWMGELEDNICAALESLPGAPYRRFCDQCGSGRVMVAEHYEAFALSPIALRLNPIHQTMDVLTGHHTNQELVKVIKRVFHCTQCPWESEPLDDKQYPEVHTCDDDKSAMEALYGIENHVL